MRERNGLGGILGNRKTYLVVVQGNINAQRYVADVLNLHALPFIRQHGPGVTLMQDNSRPHVARVTTQFLQQNNVKVMPWPAVSPDLNPIEHICGVGSLHAFMQMVATFGTNKIYWMCHISYLKFHL